MLHQLCSVWPLRWVFLQGHGQEVAKLRRPLGRILHCGGRLGTNPEHGPHDCLVAVGRLPIAHFDGCDADRPDVCLEIIWLTVQHLGAHPQRCSDGRPSTLAILELRRHAKVGHSNFTLLGQKNICAFDVSMDDAFFVQVIQALRRLCYDCTNLVFCTLSVRKFNEQVRHTSCTAVIHHDPYFLAFKSTTPISHYISVSAFTQNFHLLVNLGFELC
mmetsp:Transcript_2496/g.5942  ORF Transcript_2496/g.5942 Transcript_2496/m.5942 type:complete len:216 (-) Transcript_2496:307-954(-)